MDLKHIIIIQNKTNIAMKDDYARSHSPIIPNSAQLNYINVVIQYLCKLPFQKRDFVSPPRFIVFQEKKKNLGD